MKYFLLLCIGLIRLLVFAQQEVFFRIQIPCTAQNLIKISESGFAVDYIHQNRWIWLEIPEYEVKNLSSAGISFTVLNDNLGDFYRSRNLNTDFEQIAASCRSTGKFNVPEEFTLGSMGGFCTYDEILTHLDAMHQAYPDLITAKEPLEGGYTIENRPVYWVKVSNNPTVLQEKPRVLYTALTHSREPASMQQLLYFLYYILENYETNDTVKSVIDHSELYFIPCANPDGYIYNEMNHPSGGGLWRKNRRDNGNGSFGVDLNRNYGFMWGFNNIGSSPNPASLIYRGEYPFSEPETQLVKAFAEAYHFALVIHAHSYGNYLLFPWGYQYCKPPDHALFQEYGNLLAHANNYSFGNSSGMLYESNGDANDWFYGDPISKPLSVSFTLEIGDSEDGFWPVAERIIPICDETVELNLMAARLAGFLVKTTDFSPLNISHQTGWFRFGLKRTGLQDLPFSVSFQPVSDNFIMLENTKSYDGSILMELMEDSAAFILKPQIKTGDKVVFTITLTAENFILRDTIRKVFGKEHQLFYDDFSATDQWSCSNWNLACQYAVSPTSSISHAAQGFYSNNDTATLILFQPVELCNETDVWLNFSARWDLGGGRDYVSLMASSDNGQHWVNLKGRFAEDLFLPGMQGFSAYQGLSSDWITEHISLNDFCGDSLKLAFIFHSDDKFTAEGFYLDDLLIGTLAQTVTTTQINVSSGWNGISAMVHPFNDSLDYIFQPYNGLLMLQYQNAFYQPGNLQNSLFCWDGTYGYLLKAENDFTFYLEGSQQFPDVLELKQGWNLIPAPVDETDVTQLQTDPENSIRIIREAVGNRTFWPELQITTLQKLEPCKSYFIFSKEPALLFFNCYDHKSNEY